MSTLQVSNVHFESTGNNRLQYTGSNSYNLVGGGVIVATVNTTSVEFPVGFGVNNFSANTISVGAVLVANSTVVNASHLAGVAGASYQLNSTLAANVATLTANNTSFVGTVTAANVVSNAQLSSNLANYTTTTALTNNLANYQTTAGLSANVAKLTANNTSFVGTVTAANVVSNAQLSSNLANYVTTTALTNNLVNYQTTAGLSANVATLTANNTSFVGTVTAANVVSNAQLTSNLANYQTTAGLASNVATLSANNATYLNGQLASFYTNATNITTGTLSYAQIPANVINTTAAFTRTGITTFSANVVLGSSGLSANGSYGTAGQVLHSNGSATYWGLDDNSGTVTSVASGSGLTGGPVTTTGTLSVLANSGIIANTTGVYVDATYIGTISSNNASFLGGTAAASYQLNSTLAANVATLTANNTSFVGTVTAANVVSNAQLSANLSNYQTTAGLASNVAVLSANNASFLGTVAAASYVKNTDSRALSGNLTFTGTNTSISAEFRVVNSSANVFLATANGNVGIGNTAPTAKLEVAGSGRFDGSVTISSAGGIYQGGSIYADSSYGMRFKSAVASPLDSHFSWDDNSNVNLMRIDTLGNVGIGGSPLSSKLGVNGSTYITGGLGVGTSPSGTNGEIRASNEITAYYSSDVNLKTNIVPIENALDKLRSITGVMFDWKDNYIENKGGEDGYFVRKHDTGVIAQEVEAVLPEVVATRDDGFKAVRYEKLAGLIIQAINELADQVDELKKRIE